MVSFHILGFIIFSFLLLNDFVLLQEYLQTKMEGGQNGSYLR